jgi:cysteine-rich repeat protein
VIHKRLPAVVLLLGGLGCSTILGVKFEEYEEGRRPDAGTSPTLECVPQAISRCLCELSEGLRRCDESGRLGACVCDGGVTDRPLACGNGVVDDGEACDDGNADDGDGCSARCLPDGRPAAVEQCPGQAFVVWSGAGATFQVTGSLRAAPEDDSGTDAGVICGGGAVAPDRIFAVTSNVDGPLEVTTSATVPTLVSLRTACDSAASATSCDRVNAGESKTQTITVTAWQPVHLILEPLVASPSASFSIEVKVP